MISNILQERMKVDIRIVGQVERAARTGEEVHVYKSQIFEVFEHGELEITMPIEGGKVILLPLDLRYEFAFYTQSGIYKSTGVIKERYKSDNVYMLRIVLKAPLTKFQRRQYYRMECMLDMEYCLITNEQANISDVNMLMESLRENPSPGGRKKGTVVDISGGGIRFVSKEKNEDNSYALIIVLLHTAKREKEYMIPGRIIRCLRVDTAEQLYENRVEFIINDARMREEIIRYIFEEERRIRKNEKG
ncbi:MAG: flagellar brake protein [Roseburia sp.]